MPSSKSNMIYNWKKSGLIYDNYDELYEVYIKTMECQHCQTEFTKNNRRCLDHSHETGLFRKIVCHRCNTKDSYIKYPTGFTEQDRQEYSQEYYQANKQKKIEYQQEHYQANKQKIRQYQKEYQRANKDKIKEYKKEYLRANKERIKEQDKQKIECDCGLVVCRKQIARHKLTKKHSDYIASSLV
jgi:hypothetical protein